MALPFLVIRIWQLITFGGLLLKGIVRLNSSMAFVGAMAEASELISLKWRVSLNWRQIKPTPMLRTHLRVCCLKGKEFRWIGSDRRIIGNWLLIRALATPNVAAQFLSSRAVLSIAILEKAFDF
jgi:hypothetical protein